MIPPAPRKEPSAADGGIVQGGVQIGTGQEAPREARHGDRLDAATGRGAPRPLVQEGGEGQAQGDLVVAGPENVAREADDLGAGMLPQPQRAVPAGPLQDDGGDRGQGLHVVDTVGRSS